MPAVFFRFDSIKSQFNRYLQEYKIVYDYFFTYIKFIKFVHKNKTCKYKNNLKYFDCLIDHDKF